MVSHGGSLRRVSSSSQPGAAESTALDCTNGMTTGEK